MAEYISAMKMVSHVRVLGLVVLRLGSVAKWIDDVEKYGPGEGRQRTLSQKYYL